MRLGIRLQWLLAFGALLVLSFFPLFFAVSRLTQASLSGAREISARELGRAVASHVSDASRTRDVYALAALLREETRLGSVRAVAAYDARGNRVAVGGTEESDLPRSLVQAQTHTSERRTASGERLTMISPGENGAATVAVLLAVDTSSGPNAALVRLMALYTGVVAFALLFFAYLSMTRLVVRPVEQLSRAASKVAAGARALELPSSGASELVDLGMSLRSMTERLRSDEESLRIKVRELEATTLELKTAQETVIRSERLASVGRLAAGLAHEIGNPIAAILGFEELLLEGDLGREEQRDFLLRMKRETERISRVLRDLLDFARAPNRKVGSSEVGMGYASAAIDAALTLVGPQREMRDVEIIREVASDLPPIGIDEEKLEQVLLNLLLNAGDAVAGRREKTTGRVVVKASKLAAPGGDLVVIEVSDNGPGISDEVKASLFEPFVTTKDVGRGTGLGLAVCRGLVESANGTIVAEDADGGGARFVITLPAAPNES